MRKTTTILFVSAITLVTGCRYVGVAGGHGGEYDSTSIAVEGSMADSPEVKGWLLAGGIVYINSRETKASWPVYCVTERGYEIGGYARIGPEVAPGLFLTGLGGLTFTQIDKSCGDDSTKTEGLFGAGIVYFFGDQNLAVQVNYDNRRDMSAGLGLRF